MKTHKVVNKWTGKIRCCVDSKEDAEQKARLLNTLYHTNDFIVEKIQEEGRVIPNYIIHCVRSNREVIIRNMDDKSHKGWLYVFPDDTINSLSDHSGFYIRADLSEQEKNYIIKIAGEARKVALDNQH